MKRTRFIIALALLLSAPTAARADSHIVNTIAYVVSLTSVSGGIEEHREQKPFDTNDLCLAWKHQKEFLPPLPPAFVSFVYCEEAPPNRNAGRVVSRAMIKHKADTPVEVFNATDLDELAIFLLVGNRPFSSPARLD